VQALGAERNTSAPVSAQSETVIGIGLRLFAAVNSLWA
jgi:hypothetical protein